MAYAVPWLMRITSRPTITGGTAYTAGDSVGGLLTLTGATDNSNHTVYLDSLTIVDESNQKAAFTIILFDTNPSASTFTNDGATALNAADTPSIAGIISVAATDYVTVDSKAYVSYSGIGLQLKPTTNVAYANVVAAGAPTYTGTDDLILHFGFARH
jgi:hypothetical protein